MKYRMVVTDLDGTLLRDDKTVSDRTSRAIAALRARGIAFVIATARPVRAVRQLLPFLEFDAGIYHNGAVIMEGGLAPEGFGIAGPAAICRRILAEAPDAHIAVEARDAMTCNFDAERLWPDVEYTRTADFREVEDAVADKIIVEAGTRAEVAALSRLLPPECYAQLSENSIAMVMNRRATKLNAVRLLAERRGIGLAEVAAFGDDHNDAELLGACGAGVAVANAVEEVRAAADFVCADNQSDGVAEWIGEHILG